MLLERPFCAGGWHWLYGIYPELPLRCGQPQALDQLGAGRCADAPFIVFDDADLDAAVDGLMAAKFRNGGQTCVCPNRVYVHEAVFDAFADKLVARVAALMVAPATDPEAQIGPMINARAVNKILHHIDDAVAKGARVLTGGRRVRQELGPNYVAPTVLADAGRDAVLCCEETFGPVAPLFRFGSESEVIELANDTPFGLAGYFYSENVSCGGDPDGRSADPRPAARSDAVRGAGQYRLASASSCCRWCRSRCRSTASAARRAGNGHRRNSRSRSSIRTEAGP